MGKTPDAAHNFVRALESKCQPASSVTLLTNVTGGFLLRMCNDESFAFSMTGYDGGTITVRRVLNYAQRACADPRAPKQACIIPVPQIIPDALQ